MVLKDFDLLSLSKLVYQQEIEVRWFNIELC